jgi:hypothetical protein
LDFSLGGFFFGGFLGLWIGGDFFEVFRVIGGVLDFVKDREFNFTKR